MSEYSAGRIESFPWATPNIDPVYTLTADGNPISTGLGDPHFAITVEWDWPDQAYWSHFTIIRSIRSPARRTEEGQWMLPMTERSDYRSLRASTGRPFFVDTQPPPGEWTYYTVFVLDVNRVWCSAGSVFEIGGADYNWTLVLPELLPGASVNVRQGVADPADQASQLTQFLQGPGSYTDIAVTMGEALQYFWDPLRVPPQNLADLALSWGYPYGNALGMGRSRELLDALRRPSQGSIPAITGVVEGTTGCTAVVRISENAMMNIDDSSFESGSLADTAWEPQAGLELWDYAGHSSDTAKPIAPPNISLKYFLHVPSTAAFPLTLKCGYKTESDGSRVLAPREKGVPVGGWKKIRMGCFAYDSETIPVEVQAALSMGMDFYDIYERLIGTLEVLSPRTLDTDKWDWHGNGDGDVNDGGTPPLPTDRDVDIVFPSVVVSDPEVMTDASLWRPAAPPIYSGPQTVAPTAGAGTIILGWSSSPSTSTQVAAYAVGTDSVQTFRGWKYRATASVTAASGAAQWRLIAAGEDTGSPTVIPDGTELQAVVEWTATDDGSSIGIEVRQPSDGWASAGTHTINEFKVERLEAAHAYGVPYVKVSNACCIDLIVVDDG
jgi:hypothetical protein